MKIEELQKQAKAYKSQLGLKGDIKPGDLIMAARAKNINSNKQKNGKKS